MFGTRHVFRSCCGFANSTPTSLAPGSPFPDSIPCLCPHSSVYMRYRNFNLLSIDYVFRPRLRSPTYPEQISFTLETLDIRPEGFSPSSRYSFRHSLFLAVHHSLRYGFIPLAMLLYQCLHIPKLRCRVSAPDIFGAGTLD